jgi:hypothetical protein
VFHHLILSVKISKGRNPLWPLSWIDLGHVDVILWAPPALPDAFGFYPESQARVLLSAIVPQRARMTKTATFTRVPTYWQAWLVSRANLEAVGRYLEGVRSSCIDRTARYDALRFNCLHLAHHCLRIAGLEPPPVLLRRVWGARTMVPRGFVDAIMPNARYSVMAHDLKEEIGPLTVSEADETRAE